MEKSTRNDCSLNGKSQMQEESGNLLHNGIKEELGVARMHRVSYPVFSSSEWMPEFVRKSHADFVNGSSNIIGRAVGENFAKSIMSKSASSVVDSFDSPLTPRTGLMSDLNSLPGVPSKNEICSGVGSTATEIVSETGSYLGTLPDGGCGGWKTDVDCNDKNNVFIRPLKNEFDGEARLLSNNCGSSTKAVEMSGDSRLLENRQTGKLDDLKDSDVRIDGCVVDLKTLSCDIDRLAVDSRKLHRSKTPDSLRPLARLLHDIGLELVRQIVYKDLIDIQETKDVQNKLDDDDKNQLAKLTEAHSKLGAKCEVFRTPVRSCRCGFSCSSSNVMALHREFGQSSDQFPHVCCCCEEFRSKWPSQFIAHMETAHDAKARIQKKLAPHVCFFCAYEHKNWMKIELHMSKCANKFSLSSNLQPQPADCDIPVLYKPGQVQRIYPMNPPPVPSLPGRFPAPVVAAAAAAPIPPPATNQTPPPPQPPINATAGQSSVMEIDGQLYSLVNHNGKVLLTSLRSQIGSSSSTGPAVVPSSSGTAKKVPFPPPAARPPKPALEPIKPVVPVNRETCEICGTVVTSREALWTHFRDVHRVELSRTSMREQEPWMKCTFCSTRFWTYQGLARHSSTHHNRNIAPLPQAMTPSRSTRCYLCGHSQTSNPLNHFSTFHNITLLDMYQSRQCCMCNKRLKQSRAFEEHMIVQHRDIFANSEVLHTVIQALSTAHYLKTEDGVLQRPPLMVQQLQQNVSVAGIIAGSSTKTGSGTKGVTSTSMVSGTRTVSGSVSMPSSMRTASGPSTVSGMRTALSTNASSSSAAAMRMGSYASVVPGTRTFSHANMVSGMKMASGGVGMRNVSTTRNISYMGSVSGGKVSSPYMRSPTSYARSTTSTMQVGAKASVRTPDLKRQKAKPDSVDRVKLFEHSSPSADKSSAKKTRADEQKDLNKLYTELSDIGRPILRSMRHKLAHNDDNSSGLKRPADMPEPNSFVEANCSAVTKAHGCDADSPAQKKSRLDSVDSQEGPCRADIPGTSLTISGSSQPLEFTSKVVEPMPSGKDF